MCMYRRIIKRFLDTIISFFFLPIVFVVILIITPFIYFTDKGPVFYNAYRVGKDYKRFKMFKFRTMRVNAPVLKNPDGSTFSSDDDFRVTKIGKFLRKTSIDEIPQIINVLIGDMSLIGPRPILPGRKLEEYDEKRLKRIKVRPGITGYTQAFFRNPITQEEKFVHDAYYVDNMSFMFDIKILIKTAKTVIMRENINYKEANTTIL